MTPLCLDVKDAAAALGISTSALRGLIELGVVPVVKFPSASATHRGERSRRVLISVADLEKFVAACRVTEPVR
jgi:hypothetical protein